MSNYFLLGILSGIPWGLLYTTIPVWMRESGVALSTISLLAICKIPYTLKFGFLGLTNLYPNKLLMVISNIAVAIIIIFFASIEVHFNQLLPIFAAFTLMTFATIYDVAYDGYRLTNCSIAPRKKIITDVISYRTGITIAGAGSLYLAELRSWSDAFLSLSIIVVAGTIVILYSKKTNFSMQNPIFDHKNKAINLSEKFSITLIFIALTYKIGESLLAPMISPFCVDMSFSKDQIATYTKICTIPSIIVGTFLGNLLIKKASLIFSLIAGCIVHICTAISFIFLINNTSEFLLALVVFLETSASAITTIIIMNLFYVLSFKNGEFSVSHYTILTAAANLLNQFISIFSGFAADVYGWQGFFLFAATPMLLPLLFSISVVSDRSHQIKSRNTKSY